MADLRFYADRPNVEKKRGLRRRVYGLVLMEGKASRLPVSYRPIWNSAVSSPVGFGCYANLRFFLYKWRRIYKKYVQCW